MRYMLATRTTLALGCAALLAVAMPTAAHADTSQSTGRAVAIDLAGVVVSSGSVSASNDGQSPTDAQSGSPALSVLGGQSVLTAGVLEHRATAFNDGTSVACAGVVGSGGTVAVNPDGTCTVTVGTADVIRVSLGAVSIRADAIVASCRAESTGQQATASAQLVNARVYEDLPVLGQTLRGTLAANPAPNSSSSLVPALASIGMNTQVTGSGSVQATALTVSAVSGLLAIELGRVTCGQNVITAPTPILPLAGVPVLLGMLAIAAATPRGRRLLGRAADLRR